MSAEQESELRPLNTELNMYETSNRNSTLLIKIVIMLILLFLLSNMIILIVLVVNINEMNSYVRSLQSHSTENHDECEHISCSDIELTMKSKAGEPVQIYDVPNQKLPGVQFLSYSFNLLQGKPPPDLIIAGRYRQIIDFTYDKQQISAGSNNFLVPDQLNLPSITGVCDEQTRTSSVTTSMSTSSMFSEASEATAETSFDASVQASWGIPMLEA
eukprot:532759_1